MTLKEALLEELQKLRINRERPPVKQGKKPKTAKGNKLLEEAAELLKSLED